MILLENFSIKPSISGICKISNDIDFLYSFCDLSDVDNMIISHSASLHRRLEILNVRALIKELGLNLKITYKNRKPICDNGYISISHSDSLAAVIWNPETEYAVDIEEISPRMTRIAYRAFSEKELAFANNDIRLLTILWNCKECVYKIAGNKAVEFREQINVLPFREGEKIYCELTENNKISTFEFESGLISNHSYVWGKQIK